MPFIQLNNKIINTDHIIAVRHDTQRRMEVYLTGSNKLSGSFNRRDSDRYIIILTGDEADALLWYLEGQAINVLKNYRLS